MRNHGYRTRKGVNFSFVLYESLLFQYWFNFCAVQLCLYAFITIGETSAFLRHLLLELCRVSGQIINDHKQKGMLCNKCDFNCERLCLFIQVPKEKEWFSNKK
jgi:hypothetical protein